MVNPNVYILGGRPEIDIATTDIDGNPFTPTAVRLSVEEPDGAILTVSGDSLVTASGYLYYVYEPTKVGWHEYEVWVQDGFGRQDTVSNGFEVRASIV